MAPPTSNPDPNEESLRIAKSLRGMMSSIADQIERQNVGLRQQQSLMESIKKAQEKASGSTNAISQLGSDEMQSAIESAITESDSLSRSLGSVGTEAVKSGGLMKTMSKLASSGLVKTTVVLKEVRNGFISGMKVSTSFFGNIIRMGRTVVGTITDIAKVILGLPGTFLNFMQGAATGGTDAYRQALEELRKEFGDLSISTSRSVITMTETMRNFGATGVSFGRIFGYGREGLARLLQDFMKLAQEMGPLFTQFQQGTRGISREVIVLTKSSNITGEGLRSMQLAADNGGESVRTATLGMIRSLATAQRTFGITVKEMGRDVNYMLKEYGTFGNVTRETMIRSSVYVRRLGMSIEALKKVMDKFLNFDDAAQSAAGMAEAFNMNIDAMRLMREQDPTKRLDMMREAFFRTGRNIDQMSVAERRHLSNLSGLSEEETRMAFSQRNRAMSGAQLDAQMRRSQRTQVTQVQALQTLTRSIERLTQAGETLHGSFFQMFIDGFRRGIMWSREFRGAVRAIQQSMRVVLVAGREVGMMFAQTFPGFKQFFDGVKDVFNPRRFRVLMNQVKTEFGSFFGDLANPKRRDSALGRFMTNMRQNFLNFFITGSPAARRTMDGFRTFFTTIGRIAVQGGKFFMDKLADGVREALTVVRRVLVDRRGIGTALRELFSPARDQARGMGQGLAGTFREVLAYASEQLGPAVSSIWDSVSRFINDRDVQEALEKKVGPPLRRAGEVVGRYFLAAMFGPAVIGGVLRGVAAIIAETIGRSLVSSIGASAAKTAAPLASVALAAKAALVAVVALTAGFAIMPEKTLSEVKKAMNGIFGFFDNLGVYVGRFVKNLIDDALQPGPGMIAKAVGKLGLAFLRAIASIGGVILSALSGLITGIIRGLGFEQLANDFRISFVEFRTELIESISQLGTTLSGLPAAILQSFHGLWSWLTDSLPAGVRNVASAMLSPITAIVDRLRRNPVSTAVNRDLNNIQRPAANAGAALSNNIQNGVRNAVASSNQGTQRIVQNAQAAQQAAQTAQRAAQTAQAASQSVAAGAAPTPGAEARMINPEDFRRSMTQVRTVVGEISTMAATTFREFTADQANNVRRGVQIVTQILEAMKLIPEVANSITSSGSNSNSFTAISSLVGPQGLMSFLFDARAHREAQNMKDMVKAGGHIDQFVSAMPRNIAQSVARIGSVFTALKTITDVIGSLGGENSAQSNVYSRFIDPLIGDNGVLPLLFDFNKPSATKFHEMFMRGGDIEQFTNSLPDSYSNVNRRLNSVSSVIGTVNQIVARVAENTDRVATTFTTNSLVQASATFRANYVGQIDSLVTDFNRATAQLSQLNVGNVDLTLNRIGDTLSRERTVRLETAAANVSVNVNIKLDAADVSQALYAYSASPRARNVPGAIREGSFIPRTEMSQ